jgi:hypothetical protein
MRPSLLRMALVLGVVVSGPLLGGPALVHAQPFDHLDCYKVPFKGGEVTLDIGHAQQAFSLTLFGDVPLPDDAGCELRPRWPKEICVPAEKSPSKTPSPVGVDITNAFLCYRMKCDADLNFDVALEDQFASGTFIARGKTRRLCVPAQGVGATPTPSPTPTPTPMPTATPTPPPPTELLLLNEVNPNITGGLDLIELLATGTGDVFDFTIEQDNGGSATTVAVLPSIAVVPGDRILVHLGALASPWTTESAGPSECVDPACVASAWDVKGTAGGLAFNHRVLLLRRADTVVIDAVAFVRPDAGSPPATYPTAVQDIQAGGHWLPMTCGGADCTYESTPNVVDISADWTAATIRSGNSCRRVPDGVDVDSNADWSLGPSSWGLPNPAP